MKNKILAAILAVFVLLTALQSCNNAPDSESETQNIQEDEAFEVFEMPEKTDKLVVYRTPANEYYLTPALNIFKEKYPDIEVEIVTIPYTTTVDEFQLRLNTELAAGQGPDLLLIDTRDVPDIYKMMASETFVNLNHFIESDNEFNIDGYNQAVLDVGVFHGRRYAIPYEYNIPLLVTTQEILDAEGINPADLQTFDGFVRVVNEYNERHKDNSDKFVFRNWQDDIRDLRHLEYFFPNCGIDLIDYQTNTVAIDKAKFKDVIDMMKPMYVWKGEEVMAVSGIVINYENLKDQNLLFHSESKIDYMFFWLDYMVDKNNETILYFPYPNIDNRVTAEVEQFAAIPKASQNQINAYNLIKILLSEEIQSNYSYMYNNPVLKSAVKTKTIKDIERVHEQNNRSKYEQNTDEYVDILLNVDSCKMLSNAPYREFLLEEMKPYFEGKRSFDDCYDRLVSKLEIYISE